jgi:asparagine synthase (glutamine-hydrolysing)
VRRIPAEYKFRNGTTKYILKKALEPVLPNDILYRQKKGFGVPVANWFRQGALALDCSDVSSLRGAVITRKLAAHRAGKFDESAFLWGACVLQKWATSHRVTL